MTLCFEKEVKVLLHVLFRLTFGSQRRGKAELSRKVKEIRMNKEGSLTFLLGERKLRLTDVTVFWDLCVV